MFKIKKIHELISFFMLIACDFSALFVSFILAYLIRLNLLPIITPGLTKQGLPLITHLRYGFLYGALVILLVFLAEKLYTKRLSFWDEAKRLLKGITLSFVFIMMIVFVSRGYTQYSRPVIIIAGFISLFLFPLFRLSIKKLLVKAHIWEKKILILGTNQAARAVGQGIKTNPSLGYKVAGFVNELKTTGNDFLINDIKVLGDITQVQEICERYGIKDIVIALPDLDQNKLRELIESWEMGTETLRVVPNIGSLFSMGVEIESLGDILSLSVARNLVKPWNLIIKRSLELVLTSLFFIIFLPILFIISVAIKIDSPGPIIFAQDRLRSRNKTFRFYKFRSMYVDGDSRLDKFLKENSQASIEWKIFRKIKKDDPRVTRIGRLIRRYSLDELPQLINVLKNDMSLVGPRPYMPREKIDIDKSYPIITRVRPGITGLWQVRGRNILPFDERLLLDEYYIRNWSLWLDMVILIKTIKVFFTREGAY